MKTMQINKTKKIDVEVNISVPIYRKGDMFIVKNLQSLHLVVGASSVSGNMHIYGVERVKNEFHIPVKKVQERRDVLLSRKADIEQKIKIIEQILEE